MKYWMIDSLTLPIRWLVAYIMALAWPDYLGLVVENVPLIARRTVEGALDDVGPDATGGQFVVALAKRLGDLQTHTPDEHRVLLWTGMRTRA